MWNRLCQHIRERSVYEPARCYADTIAELYVCATRSVPNRPGGSDPESFHTTSLLPHESVLRHKLMRGMAGRPLCFECLRSMLAAAAPAYAFLIHEDC